MPNIPIYNARATDYRIDVPRMTPGGVNAAAAQSRVNPQQMTRAGRAYAGALGQQAAATSAIAQAQGSLAGSFNAIEQLGNSIGNLGQRIIGISQDTKYRSRVNQAAAQRAELLLSFQERNDYDAWSDEYKQRMEEIREEMSDGLVGSALAKFQATFDSDATRDYIKVRGLVHEKTLDAARAEFMHSQDAAFEAMAATSDPRDVQRIAGRVMESAAELHDSGVFKATEVAKIQGELDRYVATLEIKRLVAADPGAVLAAWPMEQGADPNNPLTKQLAKALGELSYEDREKLKGAAETAQEKRTREMEKFAMDFAYTYLDKRFGTDPAGLKNIISVLDDPAKIQEHKLPLSVAQIKSLRSLYKTRLGEAKANIKEARAEAERAAYTKFVDFVEQGQLGEAHRFLIQNDDIAPATELGLLKWVSGELAEQGKADKATTDSATYTDLSSRIGEADNPTTQNQIMEAFGAGRLTWADAKGLEAKRKAQADKDAKEEDRNQPRTNHFKGIVKAIDKRNKKHPDTAAKQKAILEAMIQEHNAQNPTDKYDNFSSGLWDIYKRIQEEIDPPGFMNKFDFWEKFDLQTGMVTHEGRVYRDPDMPSLTPEETDKAHRWMKSTGSKDKVMAVMVAKEGKELVDQATAALKENNKQVNAETVGKVIGMIKARKGGK